MIALADNWKDYSVIATGDGYKLERWKDVVLLRPDPQVIWSAQRDLFSYPGFAPSTAGTRAAAGAAASGNIRRSSLPSGTSPTAISPSACIP